MFRARNTLIFVTSLPFYIYLRFTAFTKSKSNFDRVSVGSPPVPSLDVCVLNIDHCDCVCAHHFDLIQSHPSSIEQKTVKFWIFRRCFIGLHGRLRGDLPHKRHHRPPQWPSSSLHPSRVSRGKSQPPKQRQLCHQHRSGLISARTKKNFQVWISIDIDTSQ